MENNKEVGVGAGVIILKDNKILLGKRKNAHGDGTWGLPGGKLDFGESWEECVRRETLEETDLEIDNIEFISVRNDIFEDKHYISIGMFGYYKSGELKVMEPDKCEKWEWFSFDNLPEKIFLPSKKVIDAYLEKKK